MTNAPFPRYHQIDAWRGYSIPELAIVGASDTGTDYDSPANSDSVKGEIERFRREVLRPAGIHSRSRLGRTSNAFCGKRWVVVCREDFDRAASLATAWLKEHDRDLHYLHDADLNQLGYR